MVMTSDMPSMSQLPQGVPALVADDPLVIMACIEAGVGVGWLPTHMTVDAVAAGRLVRVLPDLDVAGVRLFAVFPPAHRNLPKVRAFVDSLTDYLASSAQGGG